MNRDTLVKHIYQLSSFLCVGLDPDKNKMPKHFQNVKDGIYLFLKDIIEATLSHTVAYKPNIAFFERYGQEGMNALTKVLKFIPDDKFVILDAKRGDIGNTASMYAKAYFQEMGVDAVTLSPYMGRDSIKPFLEYKNKWAVLLALTSNAGAEDIQLKKMQSDKYIYQEVIESSSVWGSEQNMMYVVGATKPKHLVQVRAILPNHFLLIPGVGAQGGALDKVVKYGRSKDIGLLINASRSILYASSNQDYKTASKQAAKEIHDQMKGLF